MCDVAFLLLSFFILTTKFKPAEAIAVTTPKSVAAKVAPQKDYVMVILDANGKVFLEMDDEYKKEAIANELNSSRNLGPVSYTHLDVYKRQCWSCIRVHSLEICTWNK